MPDEFAYLPRLVDNALRDALAAAPVVILDGPRGVGKTTSARRLARSTVMLPRDLDALRADAEGFLQELAHPVLIDEWQLAGTDLLWAIKGIVDEDPTPGRFLLTGSVEPGSYGPTYPLTGRAVRLLLRPMTRAELDGRGDQVAFLTRLMGGDRPKATSGRPALFDMGWLTKPGFPAARDLPHSRHFLDAYAALVAQRAGEEGRDATRLLRTMRALATLTGQAVPDQRIWEVADVNKATWRQYDDLLERVHVSVPSPAFESNRLKRLTSYPKRFVCDTALAVVLAGLDDAHLTADPSIAGRFFESFVVQQLRPQVDQLHGALMHVRTGAGEREIDAVIEIGTSLVGVEIKLATRPTREDARALDWIGEQYPDRLIFGMVVHRGGDNYPLGERIWAVSVDDLIG